MEEASTQSPSEAFRTSCSLSLSFPKHGHCLIYLLRSYPVDSLYHLDIKIPTIKHLLINENKRLKENKITVHLVFIYQRV